MKKLVFFNLTFGKTGRQILQCCNVQLGRGCEGVIYFSVTLCFCFSFVSLFLVFPPCLVYFCVQQISTTDFARLSRELPFFIESLNSMRTETSCCVELFLSYQNVLFQYLRHMIWFQVCRYRPIEDEFNTPVQAELQKCLTDEDYRYIHAYQLFFGLWASFQKKGSEKLFDVTLQSGFFRLA